MAATDDTRYVYPPAPGDSAPTFYQRSPNNPKYAFDTAAGRYLVLCFFGSTKDAQARAALMAAYARPDVFDDERASFFGISVDPGDEAEERIGNRLPGFRLFWDFDLSVSRLYGVAPVASTASSSVALMRMWVVIDPTLRVIATVPFRADGRDIDEVFGILDAMPPPERFAGIDLQAPVLYLPRVFEPELCARLIGLYDQHGGVESGFMREVAGKTVGINDASHKRRKDYDIEDQELISLTQARFKRRVFPEIAKVHQFTVTRMERYIVACYAAEDGAHFAAHRDNTTRGTAHRRFAVSVNLNDDFDGGEVGFPEYGPRSYKAPPGGAVVFSCSLLHKVSRVTRGRRFAFLPFLYDEAAAKLREENAIHIGDGGSGYVAEQSKEAAE